ncbi:MAG: AI-2E family transporter [Pseudomonadota bacterium]|nr:AI-2E family transporter [Pseudomonadota bacterium]
MTTPRQSPQDKAFINRMLDATIRISMVLLLAYWCLKIISPFIFPIMWAIIIAVAIYPLYVKLVAAMGGRKKMAAALFAIAALALLIVPTIKLSASMIDTGQALSAAWESGTLKIPPPAEGVAEWPLIGEKLHKYWTLASVNLEAALKQIAPHLKTAGGWLFSAFGNAGIGVLQFIISILIAAVFLAGTQAAHRSTLAISSRIAGDRGEELASISIATIRSVAQGVLGVAIIQSLLAGIGLLVMDVPGAGLWALLVLVLAVVQLPPILVLGPIIVYVFSVATTGPAIAFMIWSLIVSGSDAFLKPLFLGRGMEIPMLVILLGAIGGMMTSGIIGLFIGSVVLALGYKLFMIWLDPADAEPPAEE